MESKTVRIFNESSQGRLRGHVDCIEFSTPLFEYICVRHDEWVAAGELVPQDGCKAELEDVVCDWVLQFNVFLYGDHI